MATIQIEDITPDAFAATDQKLVRRGAGPYTMALVQDVDPATKQDLLVSGVNIKTINGTTILGAGDVVISVGVAWGGITGTLSAQTDLQTALDAKLAASAASVFGLTLIDDATAGDARTTLGLGTLATQSGTFSGTSSGTNTGDQTITLTGEVTGSGTGSFAATIAANSVTYAKMQDTLLGNVVLGKSGAAGDITEIQLGLNNLLGRGSSGNLTTITLDATLGFSGAVLGVTSGTFALVAGQVFTGAISATNLSGTNTGDQTSIVGITGTKAQFDTAVTDGNILYVGDVTSNATHTGDVTGSGALTIDPTAISGKSASAGLAGTEEVLINEAGTLKKTTTQDIADLGGGGSPAGSTTQVQLNNAGAFGASANFIFDDSTNTLALPGADTRLDVTGVTNSPSAPSAGIMRTYGKPFVGRVIPAWVDSVFEEGLTQSALFDGRHRFLWTVANGSTGIALGDTVAVTGTHAIRGAQSPWTGVHAFPTYSGYANVITTANQVIGIGGSNFTFYRSTTAGSQGGFLHYCRWGYDTWTNGGRHFSGYTSDSAAVISGDPSSRDQTVGFAVDAADNGLISLLTRGTAATKASTGLTIVSGKGYDTWFYAPFNSSNIYWRIRDIATGTVAEGVATANLPAVDNRLVVAVRTSNAALTPATSVRLGVAMIYGESAR